MRAKRSILITIFLPDSREKPAAYTLLSHSPFGGTRGRSSIGRAAGDVSASHWRYVGRGNGAQPAKRKRPMVLVRAQPPAPICGCSSTAERRLSKPNAWVRFPLSAPTPDGAYLHFYNAGAPSDPGTWQDGVAAAQRTHKPYSGGSNPPPATSWRREKSNTEGREEIPPSGRIGMHCRPCRGDPPVSSRAYAGRKRRIPRKRYIGQSPREGGGRKSPAI